jgi:hypothetical protein
VPAKSVRTDRRAAVSRYPVNKIGKIAAFAQFLRVENKKAGKKPAFPSVSIRR